MTAKSQLPRIYLSTPHMSGEELELIQDAFASNWIAPLGPHVDAFQREFAEQVGAKHATALSSGTAAMHLALLLAGVSRDDEVLVSSFTFAASAFAIRYLSARPTFVDSEALSWNMDPALLAETLHDRARSGRLPKAVLLVHLYGQCADIAPIAKACAEYGVPLIEDAAEALGATYHGRAAGSFGVMGTFSFNGNKIITTAGGGMLTSDDAALIVHAQKLATQARDAAPHYEHSEIGFNYRMSNLLAAVGRGQLHVLEARVNARRQNFEYYRSTLGELPGLTFQAEAPWGRHTRWLTTVLIDPREFGVDREQLRVALEAVNVETRPLWKPMHLQPVFKECVSVGGAVSADLFRVGLCLPSGSNLTDADRERVVSSILNARRTAPVSI